MCKLLAFGARRASNENMLYFPVLATQSNGRLDFVVTTSVKSAANASICADAFGRPIAKVKKISQLKLFNIDYKYNNPKKLHGQMLAAVKVGRGLAGDPAVGLAGDQRILLVSAVKRRRICQTRSHIPIAKRKNGGVAEKGKMKFLTFVCPSCSASPV